MTEATIYTDGACSGNGQSNARGGWAAIVKLDGSDAFRELSGGARGTTNQQMEIRAAIEGLKALTRPCTVKLYSDSAYVVNCMNQHWYRKWRKNGWISSKKRGVVSARGVRIARHYLFNLVRQKCEAGVSSLDAAFYRPARETDDPLVIELESDRAGPP